MSKNKKMTAILVASVLCAGMTGTGMAAFAKADGAGDGASAPNLSENYSIGDLPYHTGHSSFGDYATGYADYSMKAGIFNAEAAGYGLSDFDTWANGSNKITSSAIAGLEIENWKWAFAANTGVVVQAKAKVTGTMKFDYSACTLGGWMDSWNTIFGVYRLNKSNNALDVLVSYRQGTDSVGGGTLTDAACTVAATYTLSVDVKEGDVVYYNVGSTADRNLQNVHAANIVVNPTQINTAVVKNYSAKLDAQVKALVQANYAESDWTAIEGFVSAFKAGTYTTADGLYTAYTAAKTGIENILPDPLKDERTKLSAALKKFYESLTESNYTSENWATLKSAYEGFAAKAEAAVTAEALKSAYDAAYAAMDAVKAYKQTLKYLDIPAGMIAAKLGWIEGDVFDVKAYTGSVKSGLIALDKSEGENTLFNESLGTLVKMENWKWTITKDNGIILAYKAKVDCKITLTNTRMADDAAANNGWTDECVLSGYIVRGEETEKISTVNVPKKDADFNAVYYAKAGDILYVEFTSTVINLGDQRNTESPMGMTALADSTGFDANAYAEQNHDLSADATKVMEEKKTALEEYYAGLTETEYSATNWLELADKMANFPVRCKAEAKTAEDVTKIYEEIFAEMKAIPTLAEAAAVLKTTLDGYAAELQAEYDKLVKENKYSSQNKTALDKALADGKSAIAGAKTATAGNTAKNNAISALRKVEKSSSSGCGSMMSAVSAAAIVAVGAFAVVALRRTKENN